MKLLSRTSVYRTSFSIGFFVFPLLVVSSGATNPAQQVPAVNAPGTSPATHATQKFTVTVTDSKGHFISGLTKEEFAVREGKTDQALSYFNAEDTPASVGLLVDVSGSVEGRTLEAAKYTAARFIELSNQKNEYFVAEFSSRLQWLTDWTRDGRTISDALHKLATENGAQPKPKPKGPTALNDVSIAVLERMAGGGAHSKRVLLIISDGGMDNKSKHTFKDLKRKIRESDVLVYSIIIIASPNGSGFFLMGEETMDELAMLSGGWAYYVHNKNELNEALERLALELRQQYVIGFEPTNALPGGKWNKVKIKVTPRNPALKNLFVRSREGYFSPPSTLAP